MRTRLHPGTGALVAALLAWCLCPTVASMERSAIEEPRGASQNPHGATLLRQGYDARAVDAASIDRLRMAADAGRDDEALRTLLAMANAGSVPAQRAAGDTLLRRKDAISASKGLSWLTRAAGQGDASAALSLGRAWLVGASAAPRDEERARGWFLKAYASDATRAQAAYYLGLLARATDPAQAVAYLRESAGQGIADAMYLLGNACAAGEGTDQDSREAMRWYLRAAALDHPAAIQELAFAFQRGDTLLPQSDLQAANMRLAMEHALRHPKAAP